MSHPEIFTHQLLPPFQQFDSSGFSNIANSISSRALFCRSDARKQHRCCCSAFVFLVVLGHVEVDVVPDLVPLIPSLWLRRTMPFCCRLSTLPPHPSSSCSGLAFFQFSNFLANGVACDVTCPHPLCKGRGL